MNRSATQPPENSVANRNMPVHLRHARPKEITTTFLQCHYVLKDVRTYMRKGGPSPFHLNLSTQLPYAVGHVCEVAQPRRVCIIESGLILDLTILATDRLLVFFIDSAVDRKLNQFRANKDILSLSSART